MLKLTEAAQSLAGRKAQNQDFCASQRTRTGAVFALADGVSSSAVSAMAAEHAVNEFIAVMRRMNELMTVRSAGVQVLDAINERLRQESLAQGLSDDRDKGYVCAFTALVLKGRQAHLFHVGDTRLYRWRAQRLECLTQDHRAWLGNGRSCLARALGAAESVSVDYRMLDLAVGDVFVLSSDGVHDFLDDRDWAASLNDTDVAAHTQRLLQLALARGSDDNLSLQLVRIDALDNSSVDWIDTELAQRPFAPDVDEGDHLDGLTLVKSIHTSPRSRVFQAIDDASGATVLLKLPSREGQEDAAYLRRFLLEEWIGRQLDSPHIVGVALPERPRRYLYTLLEWIDGQTLDAWQREQASPSLDAVRDILDQAGRAVQAMHRRDLLHQDIKPDNLMIDRHGHVTLIDFGSTRVAGLAETDDEPALLGTALYTAPEYFLGEFGDERADQFSLALLGYFLLSGSHPYGTAVAKARSAGQQSKLRYRPLRDAHSELPAWFDATLAKALAIQPERRYAELSEFLYDLRHPNPNLKTDRRPLLERHPVRVWQGISALLALALLWQWWSA
ncbi:bifunctional protein-serine/threonine kinase/phosphatase [Saccharospirillum mangrovi]|uniref:bifunctional protein-serine/threonine kinase/phosphatase n=1 Tax=Saccharospirillum mangrovi TaxID=2161747 RepID=UPI000D36C723|nr:bifunctional protein-serine/threonine kinase/phosphatase [Saccharospirillum mangrovi]